MLNNCNSASRAADISEREHHRSLERKELDGLRRRVAELEEELAERERMIAIAAYHATCRERWKGDTTAESVKHYIRVWLDEAREEAEHEQDQS